MSHPHGTVLVVPAHRPDDEDTVRDTTTAHLHATTDVGLLDLACPSCEADAGEDCWADRPHLDRVDLADERSRARATDTALAA